MRSDSRPQLKAPRGACDTHMHIYDHRFPKAPTAKIDPPDASLADYLAMRPRLGIRGVRFFMLAGAPLPIEILETMAARVAPFGWHVQFQTDGRVLPEHETMLQRLPTILSIDHVGKFLEPVEPDHPGFRTLLRLLDNGRTWIKLAAPYETSKLGPPYYDDVGKLAKLLVKAAPERTIWATNWPHLMSGERKPKDSWMLDMLLDWVPHEATRNKVLVDNPAKLYGF